MEKHERITWFALVRGGLAAAGRLAFAVVCALLVAQPAQAQFGNGTHGVFPPTPDQAAIPSNWTYLVWNVRTGRVWYCSTYTPGTGLDGCDAGSPVNVEARIQNVPPSGLTTGIYEFQDFAVSGIGTAHRSIIVVGTSPNTPLSILSQTNISLSGTSSTFLDFYVQGWPGQTPLSQSPNLSVVGGRGGPGGFDGGASGNGSSTTPANGSAGLGPAGGAGGVANSATAAILHGTPAQASQLNPSLTPLAGGSGGGGGAGVSATPPSGCSGAAAGFAGGGGGGGGGALLLAAAGRVTLVTQARIFARGGNGGASSSGCGWGAGGAGGSVRIVASEFTGNGTIYVNGGPRFDGFDGPPLTGPGGFVRFEATFNTFTGGIIGSAGGSFVSFPTAPVPSNQPVLRITSINGASTPTTPSASLTAPDVTFPSAINTPVTLTVEASNVPTGTVVNIRVVPAVGSPSNTATGPLDGSVASSNASATVTLPPGPGVVTATATFNVAQSPMALNTLPMIDGERPQRAEVVTFGDGTSKTYLIARSGARFEFNQARP
jgi:hypothetical protein